MDQLPRGKQLLRLFGCNSSYHKSRWLISCSVFVACYVKCCSWKVLVASTNIFDISTMIPFQSFEQRHKLHWGRFDTASWNTKIWPVFDFSVTSYSNTPYLVPAILYDRRVIWTKYKKSTEEQKVGHPPSSSPHGTKNKKVWNYLLLIFIQWYQPL